MSGSEKGKNNSNFLSRIGKSYSSNSQLNHGNSKLPNRADTNSDSDSDVDLSFEANRANTTRNNLPSFKHRTTGEGSKSKQLIEQDAVRTIRYTSGGAYDDGEDEEPVSEEMDRQYRKECERFACRNSSSSSSAAGEDFKSVRFKSNTEAIDDYDDDDDDDDDDEKSRRKNSTSSSTSSSTNDDGKFDHFKQFFQRGASQRRHGMKNLNSEDDDEDKEEDGVLSKIINNFSNNGGLTPGFPNDSDPASRRKEDVEKAGGQEAVHEDDDIPMVDFNEAAQQIVQAHSGLSSTQKQTLEVPDKSTSDGETMYESGSQTPTSHSSFVAPPMEQYIDGEQGSDPEESDGYDPFVESTAYVAPPTKVRGGVLGSLLKLYQNEDVNSTYSSMSLDEPSRATSEDPTLTPSLSPTNSRLKLPKASNLKKLKNIPNAYRKGTDLLPTEGSKNDLPSFKNTRPKGKKNRIPKFKKKVAAEARITVHIADLLQRHRFILRMCKALMLYGAPTHRLEEYMIMTSRVLEIDGQFLYLPGCMIVSFGDATTRTSEVQLIRCAQGLNLWKLHQVHTIYKQVIHDTMSAAEGNVLIDTILQDKNLYPPWVCVFLYGFCSAMVTPYAFGGEWINLAISFFMGSCVGALQYIVSQRSNMYSNVFEVTSSIVVSFCGRAFGSIPNSNICFGSVTQGSLALILPGYIILCGSLELQSRNLVAGSVRMFYAIIYSLFLGFGITLGAALFGWMYDGATNETSCSYPISPWFRFLFVPAFTIGISLINQANWTQLPVMVVISCTGYVVTYWAGTHFQNSTEFTAALAAFVIGLMGNLYSRIWKGLAVSAMLPAIFVQVPSGVASQSSLLSGLQSANQLVNHNGTSGTADLSSSMSFGITMIQVSIGITVGLFASTIFIYPFGKKKTGLFSL